MWVLACNTCWSMILPVHGGNGKYIPSLVNICCDQKCHNVWSRCVMTWRLHGGRLNGCHGTCSVHDTSESVLRKIEWHNCTPCQTKLNPFMASCMLVWRKVCSYPLTALVRVAGMLVALLLCGCDGNQALLHNVWRNVVDYNVVRLISNVYNPWRKAQWMTLTHNILYIASKTLSAIGLLSRQKPLPSLQCKVFSSNVAEHAVLRIGLKLTHVNV